MGNAKSTAIVSYDDAMLRLGPERASYLEAIWKRITGNRVQKSTGTVGMTAHAFVKHVIGTTLPDMPPQLAGRLFLAMSSGGLENVSTTDRTLGIEDWIVGMCVLTKGLPKERAQLLWRVYDTEGVEKVTHGELVRYMHLILIDRATANAPALYSRAVDELFNEAWALSHLHPTPSASSSAAPAPGTGAGGKVKKLHAGDSDSARASASLTPSEWSCWATHQACPSPPSSHPSWQATPGRAHPSSAWAKHPLLGWLDHVAVALEPKAEYEALLVRWCGPAWRARRGSVQGGLAHGAAQEGSGGRSSSSRLSGKETAALQAAFSSAKARSSSGLFDRTALAHVLSPVLSPTTGLLPALLRAMDRGGHGAVGSAEWIAWAEVVLKGEQEELNELLFHSYHSLPPVATARAATATAPDSSSSSSSSLTQPHLKAMLLDASVAGRLVAGMGEGGAIDPSTGSVHEPSCARIVSDCKKGVAVLLRQAVASMGGMGQGGIIGKGAFLKWAARHPELLLLYTVLLRQCLRVDCGVRPEGAGAGEEEATLLAPCWRSYKRSTARVGDRWYVLPAQWWREYSRALGLAEAISALRAGGGGGGGGGGVDGGQGSRHGSTADLAQGEEEEDRGAHDGGGKERVGPALGTGPLSFPPIPCHTLLVDHAAALGHGPGHGPGQAWHTPPVLRQGLKRGFDGDYVLLSPRAWTAVSAWYGVSGPPIERCVSGQGELEMHPLCLRVSRLLGMGSSARQGEKEEGKGQGVSTEGATIPASPASAASSGSAALTALLAPSSPAHTGSASGASGGSGSTAATAALRRTPVLHPVPNPAAAPARPVSLSTFAEGKAGANVAVNDVWQYSRWESVAGVVRDIAVSMGVQPGRVRLWRRVPAHVLAPLTSPPIQPGSAAGGKSPLSDLLPLFHCWPYVPLFPSSPSPSDPPVSLHEALGQGEGAPHYPPIPILVDIRTAGPEGSWASESVGYAATHAALVLAAQAGRLEGTGLGQWYTGRQESGRDSMDSTDQATAGKGAGSSPGLPTPVSGVAQGGGQAGDGSSTQPPVPGSRATPIPYHDYCLLPAYSAVGLGCVNLGNSCYLSAALQLLLSLPLFPHYFLSRSWEADLNRTARFGTGGKMAAAVASTVLEAWAMRARAHEPTRPAVLAPRRLKAWLARTATRFEGIDQHDAADALSTLLAALNEDLNRVPGPNKPYVEVRDSEGRPDWQCAQEWWTSQVLGRDRSIITQLFTGQFKSTLTCEACGHTSARFEPFTLLSLPLPEAPARALTLMVHPLPPAGLPLMVTLHIQPAGTIADVKKALCDILASRERGRQEGEGEGQGREGGGGVYQPPLEDSHPPSLARLPYAPEQWVIGRCSGQEWVEEAPCLPATATSLAQSIPAAAEGPGAGGVAGGSLGLAQLWAQPAPFLHDSLPIAAVRDGAVFSLVAWRVCPASLYTTAAAAAAGGGGGGEGQYGAGTPVWALWKGKPGRAYAAWVHAGEGEGQYRIQYVDVDGASPTGRRGGGTGPGAEGGGEGEGELVPADHLARRVPLPARLLLHNSTMALIGSGSTPVGLQLGPAQGGEEGPGGPPTLPPPPVPVGAGALAAPTYATTVAYPASVLQGHAEYVHTPLARVSFGHPLLLSALPEYTSGCALYWRVWQWNARAMRRRAPYDSLHAAVEGEAAAAAAGGGMAHSSILARWGFVLRRTTPSGACPLCPWLAHCPGCIVLPHPGRSLCCPALNGGAAHSTLPVLPIPGNGNAQIDPLSGLRPPAVHEGDPPWAPQALPRLLVDWDPLLLEACYDRSEAGRVEVHPSVPAARAAADRPVSVEACLELFTREERLEEPGYCPQCSRVQVPVLKRVRAGRGGQAGAGESALLVAPQPMARALQSPTLPTTTLASFTQREGSSTGQGQGVHAGGRQGEGQAGSQQAQQAHSDNNNIEQQQEQEQQEEGEGVDDLVQVGLETEVQLRPQRKRIAPYRLPPILLLQLKRFQHTAYVRRKLQTLVTFPVSSPLCMRPHLARTQGKACPVDLSLWLAQGGKLAQGEGEGEAAPPPPPPPSSPVPPSPPAAAPTASRRLSLSAGPMDAESAAALGVPLFLSRSSCCYELWAVIQHHGIMGGGHYTALVKAGVEGQGQGQGGPVAWQWRLVNDKAVTPVISTGPHHGGGLDREVCSAAAYVLAYVRVDIAAGWREGMHAGDGRAAAAACPCSGCMGGAGGPCHDPPPPPLALQHVWPMPPTHLQPAQAEAIGKVMEEVQAAGSLNTATGTLATVLAAVPGVGQERAASMAQAAAGGVAAAADKCAIQ